MQQPFDRGPRVVAGRESVEVSAVFVAAVKVADHPDRGDDARQQRAEARAFGAHLGESVAAVDEDPVEADVGQVGDDRDRHFDFRVAHAFEELFEGEEQHDERHAVNQHLVVGDGHIDHFGGLAEMVEQRDGGILHDGHRQAEQSVEEDAVLQQARRFLAVALGVEFAHEGRHAECDADGGDEEDEEDRAAERHGSQRRGVVSAVAADHKVVGELRQDLAQLREHHGQRQPQVGLVLVFVCCEFVHRCAKVRILARNTAPLPAGAAKIAGNAVRNDAFAAAKESRRKIPAGCRTASRGDFGKRCAGLTPRAASRRGPCPTPRPRCRPRGVCRR